MLSLEDTFTRSPAVVAREFDGEMVLMPVAGSVVDMRALFVLNSVATKIWQRLDGVTSLATIVKEIAASHDVGENVAARDAAELVHSLLEAGLAERR